MEDCEARFKTKVIEKLKGDIYKAQRMYYLSQKLDSRVLPCLKQFSKDTLNKYTKIAKEVDIKLTIEELYNRLFNI